MVKLFSGFFRRAEAFPKEGNIAGYLKLVQGDGHILRRSGVKAQIEITHSESEPSTAG